jgi:uncharacterized protein (DUF1800 family)
MHASRRLKLLIVAAILALAVSLVFAKKSPSSASVPSAMSEPQRAWHALNRLTFGPRPGDLQHVMAIGVDQWIDSQLQPSGIDDSALDARLAPLLTLRMSTAELLDNFPSTQMVKMVADGKLPLPSDPVKRAVYEAELQRLREQQERKQMDTSMPQAMAPMAASVNPAPEAAHREEQKAAQHEADNLLQLTPEQRFGALLIMSNEQRRPLAALKPEERELLLAGFTPQEREAAMALANPQMVVATELRESKLLRAIYSERQLDEVMTDFWFNHFNVFLDKGPDHYLITAYERDVIRPHALGKFKDLLLATAQSPAMLFYLDNWTSVGPDSDFAEYGPAPQKQTRGAPPAAPQNKKPSGLNENYARELMELHTLGVNGGYTQNDVTEVAKVFTGWTLKEPNRGGGFQFIERRHEPGVKKVLGQTVQPQGEQEGLEVLDLLARNPATAHFISTKLAQRFVCDDPPPALVNRMARTFLATDGDIREVLRTLFHSPEFWSPDAYRAKVKTPLEFVASAVRASGADVQNAMPLVQALSRMGMPLYEAQPPTGYSMQAGAWVNSAALLERMNFALALAEGHLPGIRMNTQQMLTNYGPAEVRRQTVPVIGAENIMLAEVENAFLAGDVSRQTHETIDQQLNSKQPNGDIRNPNLGIIAGLIMGSPEFQRR